MLLVRHRDQLKEPICDLTEHSTTGGRRKDAHPSHTDLSSPSNVQCKDTQNLLDYDYGKSTLMEYFGNLVSPPLSMNPVYMKELSMDTVFSSLDKWTISQLQHQINERQTSYWI